MNGTGFDTRAGLAQGYARPRVRVRVQQPKPSLNPGMVIFSHRRRCGVCGGALVLDDEVMCVVVRLFHLVKVVWWCVLGW